MDIEIKLKNPILPARSNQTDDMLYMNKTTAYVKDWHNLRVSV